MAVIHGSEANFNELINKKIVLVDFYAEWCGPCKMLSPVLEEIQGIDIVKIDVDEFPALARKFGIMTVPTLIVFKEGKLISQQSGVLPRPMLEKWIDGNK